jgi:hypothetical protein
MAEDNSRDPSRYFDVLQRFGSPEEIEALRQVYGTPKAITERHRRIEMLLDRDERRDAVWQFLKYLVIGLIGAATLLSTIKGILPAGWPW